MAKTRYDLIRITALSNMHVGSGEINFGVVDNLVQKDVVIKEFPTINSSSLKGALREFFEEEIGDPDLVKIVFGPSPAELASNRGQQGEGLYNFFSAHLLSIPVRSNKKPFFRAVSPCILNELLENSTFFGINLEVKAEIEGILSAVEPQVGQPVIFEDLGNDVSIEDMQATFFQKTNSLDIPKLEDFLGKDIVILHDNDLKEACAELPVVARNYLENGESKNLWYEEVVPRQTRFYFILGSPSEGPADTYTEFMFRLEGNLIQIGANATIGYGFTKINRITKP